MRIVVDTSALLAVLLGESERDAFEGALLDHEPVISAGTLIETLRVIQSAIGPEALTAVDRLLAVYEVEIVPMGTEQVALAREGMIRFGKGRVASPAVLNFGDLFAYALARLLDAPLLFKGDDFALTDLTPLAIRSAR